MSIVRQLIQIGLVEACRDQTIALGNVFDSRMDTLDGLMDGERRPVLIFSVEESESRRVHQTDGLLGRSSRFTVMVQSAVASGQEIRDEQGAVVLQAIGETDSSFEAQLNILDWQWRAAIADPRNDWAELVRNLMVEVGQIKDQRATDPETGTKHAARFTQFELDAMPDPMPGDVIPEVIEQGFALLEADPAYAVLAETWRALLGQGTDMDDLQRLLAKLFSSSGSMAALGYAEPASSSAENPGQSIMVEVSIEAEGIRPVPPVTADDP